MAERCKQVRSSSVEREHEALRSQRARLAAVHGLLVHAAIDIGVKAAAFSAASGGSSKLLRAFEDVASARDALREIIDEVYRPMKLSEANKAASLPYIAVRTMALQAASNGSRDWASMQSRQCQKLRALLERGDRGDTGDDEAEEHD